MMRDVAALGAVAPLLAFFGLSPDGATAFLALCGPLFVLFLMALLENAASIRARRAAAETPFRPSIWLRRSARALLLATLTSAVSLVMVQVSVALAAS